MKAKILEDGKVEITTVKTEVQVFDGEQLVRQLAVEINSLEEALVQIKDELDKKKEVYESIKSTYSEDL